MQTNLCQASVYMMQESASSLFENQLRSLSETCCKNWTCTSSPSERSDGDAGLTNGGVRILNIMSYSASFERVVSTQSEALRVQLPGQSFNIL